LQLHFDLHLDLTILAMWGNAPDCLFAVGDEGLILHFDGLGWKRMPSGTQSALYGLWGWGEDRLAGGWRFRPGVAPAAAGPSTQSVIRALF